MTDQASNKATPSPVPAEVWAARTRNNVRLAWVFGGLAFLFFVVALWKLRPM